MRRFLVMVLAVSAVMVIGCNDESGDEKTKIGVVQITLEHEYQVILNKGFKDKAKEMGAEVLVRINDMTPDKCVTAAENLIAAGAKAIIVAPADAGSFKAVASLCKREGVILLNDGSPQPIDKDVAPFIGTDSYSGGLKAADFAGKWIKENLVARNKKIVVAHLTLPMFSDCVRRNEGFVDGLKKQLAGVKYEIYSENGEGSREGGLTATENLLQAHPDINVVFGCNDDSALGGYSAMKAAGKTDAENLVIGFDGSLGAFEAIKKGGMFRADIVQLPYKYAGMHMERAVKLVRGEAKVADYQPEGHLFIDPPIVTKDNVDEFIEKIKKRLGK